MGFGSLIGGLAGSLGSKLFPIPGVDGEKVGSFLGNLSGYKNGGKIPGKRGKAKVILAHSGEYVLPCGVNPTAFQKKEVAKRKKRASKKK
jgi:hypothetical protein